MNCCTITADLFVNKDFADIKDTLFYSIVLKNSGNDTVYDITISKFLPSCTTLEKIILNGVPKSIDNFIEYNINSLNPKETCSITFMTKISSLPDGNIIKTNANISFKESLKDITTNTVSIQINHAKIISNMSVDTDFAHSYSGIKYEITLKNIGNTPATNVKFLDILPKSIKFVFGSLMINGNTINKYLDKPLNLFDINPSDTTTLEFFVVPTPFKILDLKILKDIIVKNKCIVNYEYKNSKSIDPIQQTSISNTVTTQIEPGFLQVMHFLDKNNASIGEDIKFQFKILNVSNITATDLNFKDIIPDGLKFISDSVFINDIAKPSVDPNIGIKLPNISPKDICTLYFKCKLIKSSCASIINRGLLTGSLYLKSQPIYEKIYKSNISIIQTKPLNIDIVTSTDKDIANLNDCVNFNIDIINNNLDTIGNLMFKNSLPKYLNLKEDSIKINDVSIKKCDICSDKGIKIQDIRSKNTTNIKFSATVSQVPPLGYLFNLSFLKGYIGSSSLNFKTQNNLLTNSKFTKILFPKINSTITCNKNYGEPQDILVYTINLKNIGNVKATNVTLKNILSKNLTLIEDSIVLDSKPQLVDFKTFNIKEIPIGDTATITFKAKINNSDLSKASVNVETVATFESIESKTFICNCDLEIGNGQLIIEKHSNKQKINLGDTLTYYCKIKNTGNKDVFNVLFKEPLLKDTTFVPKSVTINSIDFKEFNPIDGIFIKKISKNTEKTIAFDIKVSDEFKYTSLETESKVSFEYNIDSYKNPIKKDYVSSPFSISINRPYLVLKQVCNKTCANLNDILKYNVEIQNLGNVKIENIIVENLLPSNLTLKLDSLLIDKIKSIEPIEDKINIAYINPEDTVYITFDAIVSNTDNRNCKNKINLTYNFNKDKENIVKDFVKSNELNIVLNKPIIIEKKPINKNKPKINSPKTSTQSLIENTCIATYSYMVNPNDSEKSSTSTGNILTNAKINNATLLLNTYVNKPVADLNDILKYNICVENIGNVPASNVLLKYFINPIDNIDLILESFKISNVDKNLTDFDFLSDINLGTINPNQIVNINFKGKIIGLSGGCCKFKVTADYAYKVNPLGKDTCKTTKSKVYITTLNNATIKSTMFVNNDFVDLNDIFTYDINLKNTGTVTANNIKFKSILPSNIEFLPDSFKINSKVKTGLDPNLEVPLPSIDADNNLNISFSAKAISIHGENPIKNLGTTKYTYLVTAGNEKSNISTTPMCINPKINNANLILNANVDKTVADLHETLNYNIMIKNTGNVSATHVILKYIFTSNLEINTSSIKINDTLNSSYEYDINNGLNLGTIQKNESITVSFSAFVKSITGDISKVSFNTNYSYKVNPSNAEVSKETPKVDVITTLKNATIESIKSVNKAVVDLDGRFTYTILLKNTGNVQAKDIVFKDTLPNNIKFLPNTFNINSISKNNADPNKGVSLDVLEPGNTVSVSFDAKALSLKNPNPIENKSTTTYKYVVSDTVVASSISNTLNKPAIKNATLILHATVNKSYADLNDILTYTIILKNTGNISATDVVLKTPLTSNIEFNKGSVQIITINNASVMCSDVSKINLNNIPSTDKINSSDNPTSSHGMNMKNINPDAITIITFTAKVIRITNNICNAECSAYYKYKLNSIASNISKSTSLIKIPTTLRNATIKCTKSVNKEYVDVGDILTYTITLKNVGNTAAENIIFKDALPSNLKFIQNTLKINSSIKKECDPIVGIPLNPICAGEKIIVCFDVKVLSISKEENK